MEIINFIINNILTQAGITLALIALLGLILQKKSFGNCLSGAFKTLLGFMVLSAGSAIIVGSLTYFGKFLQKVLVYVVLFLQSKLLMVKL